jgi:ribosomal protein S18 acetylase RimI-like enzyme
MAQYLMLIESGELTYRKAGSEEYESFFDLMTEETEAYLDHALSAIGLTREKLAQSFRTVGNVYAVELSSEVVGLIWLETRGNILHIHALVLRPEAQGKGLGSRIMADIARDMATGVDTIEVGVHESNARALALCEKRGFILFKRRPEAGFVILQKKLY